MHTIDTFLCRHRITYKYYICTYAHAHDTNIIHVGVAPCTYTHLHIGTLVCVKANVPDANIYLSWNRLTADTKNGTLPVG